MNNPAYADYFLVGRFGEICTMCEVVVLCEADADYKERESVPADGRFTLYYLQTRTFWSQIATIWEWFISNFSSESLESGHSRPVIVYTAEAGQWSAPLTIDAHIALQPAEITLGEHTINRVDRRWLQGSAQQPVGYCQRMPLWTSLDVIEANAPGKQAP